MGEGTVLGGSISIRGMHMLPTVRRSVLIAGILTTLMVQVARAQSVSPQQPPAARSAADAIQELQTLKQRIDQLESQLKSGTGSEKPAAAQTATPASTAPQSAPDAAKELEALKQQVEQLEAELKKPASDKTSGQPAADPGGSGQAAAEQQPGAPAAPAPVDLQTPFAYADYTWMNSIPRNHDEVLDGKYFSGEFRVDTNYMYDFEHPIDHTLIGTTEGERTGEFVIQALNVGGDFHAGNMQGRILTQFGAVSTAVPRNDASYSQGQWDLADAYRYLTEMYAGYHIDVQHGLNIQVGDFLSYIGLFSYYSFDNWAYQPSYVSSNTPWFFTGMRVQWFPTNKLKIEPWLINGWQTYAKYNGREGVGGQILWRPTGNLDFVFNTYTLGRDVLGNDKRSRYHEDDSMEWKYFENPNKMMHRMAFSLTWDIGCETGGGVSCMHGNAAAPSQNFEGIMAYHRWWFDHDKFGATIGGGVVNNPGRYLVLLPPINGANATTGSPYFTENPGDKFRGYDYQLTFDYMPSQWVTWRVEFTQRGANVPYFSGPGGITPQVTPGLYVNTGDPTAIVPGFSPDLRKQERRFIFSVMVKL